MKKIDLKRVFVTIVFLLSSFNFASCGGGNGGTGGGAPPPGGESSALSSDADLVELKISDVVFAPEFNPSTTNYSASSSFLITSVKVSPKAAHPAATVTVNGTVVSSGASSEGITLNEGENSVTVIVTAEGGNHKTYIVELTRQSLAAFSHQAYLKASNSGNDDQFGWSVSLFGDTLAVGADWEASSAEGVNSDQTDDSIRESGAVYIFVRSENGWIQQAYLKASNTLTGGRAGRFGHSVSLWGDTLAVGAILESSSATGVDGNQADSSAPQSGAVYIFTRRDGVWSQQAYLKASNTESKDWFGWSVSLSEDTLAVSAYLEDSDATGINGNQTDNSAPFSGAVYLFTRRDNLWSQQAYLKASNTEANDRFGTAVSVSGDTLAVGAYREASSATGVDGNQSDNGAFESGAVYVFTRNGGIWSQQAYLKPLDTEAGEAFGFSLSLSGDTLAVGAVSKERATGAVYVFVQGAGTWSQEAMIKGSNTRENDLFGRGLSLSGDRLVVGALGESSNATGINGDPTDDSEPGSGAVYLFTRKAGNWTQQAYIKAADSQSEDQFGNSLSLFGDTLAVGAYWENNGVAGVDNDPFSPEGRIPGVRNGAVYLFR